MSLLFKMAFHTVPLAREFYRRDTIDVAHDLLGCLLVHESAAGRTSGWITETEAYLGIEDPACHTFRARRTDRVRSMYLDGGHSYIYLIYGMHWCFNVVTGTPTEPEAVLVRAVAPLEGLDLMCQRRHMTNLTQLTNGPGKLCSAFGIDRRCDGLDLLGDRLFILPAPSANAETEKKHIESGPRVGIDSAGDAAFWPLRFQLKTKFSSSES